MVQRVRLLLTLVWGGINLRVRLVRRNRNYMYTILIIIYILLIYYLCHRVGLYCLYLRVIYLLIY